MQQEIIYIYYNERGGSVSYGKMENIMYWVLNYLYKDEIMSSSEPLTADDLLN